MAYMPSLWSAVLDLIYILGVHPMRPARPGTRRGVLAHYRGVHDTRGQREISVTPKAAPMKCAACQTWRRRLYHCVICGKALCGCCSFSSRGGRVCCYPGAAQCHHTLLEQLSRTSEPHVPASASLSTQASACGKRMRGSAEPRD